MIDVSSAALFYLLLSVFLLLLLLLFVQRTGEDRLEVVARDFRVTNSRQELLFAANRKEVVVGADILRVSGEFEFPHDNILAVTPESLSTPRTVSRNAYIPCGHLAAKSYNLFDPK